MRRLSCDQIRRIDRLAIEQLGIPGVVLMENAGRRAAAVVRRLVRRRLNLPLHTARATIICGGGNNGGDGYVMARHLVGWGMQIQVYSAVDVASLRGEAAINASIVRRMCLPIHSVVDAAQLTARADAWNTAHILVDALLGTGVRGSVREHAAAVIGRINRAGATHVLSVDVPSGLDGDSGEAPVCAVRADVTVTFVASKRGFDAPSAKPHIGRVIVADIGIPPSLVDQVARPQPPCSG